MSKLTRQQIREALISDKGIDAGSAERGRFLSFAQKLLPTTHLHTEDENVDCYSLVRNYNPISAVGFSDRSHKLTLANLATKTSKKFQHIFGNQNEPCEGCLRRLEAFALHHAIDSIHQSNSDNIILTPKARTIVESFYDLRRKEKRMIDSSSTYLQKSLHLIRLEVPNSGAPQSDKSPDYHTTRLVFYDSSSVRRGQQVLEEMLRKSPEMREIAESFGEIRANQPRQLPRKYFSSESQDYVNKETHGRMTGKFTTILEILSRSDYKPIRKSVNTI